MSSTVKNIVSLLKDEGYTPVAIENIQKMLLTNKEFTEEITSKNEMLKLANNITNAFHEGLTSDDMLTIILETVQEISSAKDQKDIKKKHILNVLKDKYCKSVEYDPKDGISGYPCERLHNFTKGIDGWKPGVYLIGGQANVGKSTFVMTIALGFIESNRIKQLEEMEE